MISKERNAHIHWRGTSGSGNTTVPSGREDLSAADTTPRLVPALFFAQSYKQPDRIGECCRCDPGSGSPIVVGREGDSFDQVRAGEIIAGGPLTGINMSHRQLRGVVEGDAFRFHNIGEASLSVNGTDVDKGAVFMARPGDVLHLHHNCVLLVGLAPVSLPAPHDRLLPLHSFGAPDIMGMTGESWRAWELRERILYAAKSGRHVFILGPTGTGKELVAKAIHRMSPRCSGPYEAANGAAFSSELTAYHLFGNRKGAPNAGSPESLGFFGVCAGGYFFLDEIGEMSHAMQAALLRALEAGYHRIGESRARPTECLVICATNRGTAGLKEDVLTRLGVTIIAPPLAMRREDIALIVRALLLKRVREEKGFGEKYLRRDAHGWEHVPVHSSLIIGLLRSPLTGNVRELDNILTESIMAARGELPLKWPRSREMPPAVPLEPPAEPSRPDVDELLSSLHGEGPSHSRASVLDALARNKNNIGKTAAYLRMSVRELYRLREKYGLLDPQD